MRYLFIFLFALLTACGSAAPSVKPFKMDIQQGNVVTSKMLLQLRPGMTKSQVKFIMGSPLIVDSFHKNRWDYFYQLRQAGKITEQRRVILDFDKELLTKVRGDVVPEGTAGAATGNESSVAKTITVEPKPKEETSWADKLKFWKSDEKPTAKPEPTKEAEKAVAPEASINAPTGDAATIDAPAADTASVLAVPIGGVLAPSAEAPAATPSAEAPSAEAPIVAAPEPAVPEPPMLVQPVVIAPMVEAPVNETPPAAVVKKEVVKAVEIPKSVETPKLAAKPVAKAGERLIFRMDKNLDLKNLDLKNLDLKNLQAPIDAVPEPMLDSPKVDIKAAPTTTKPKKIEQPVPAEEAPGYFERMLEKIGF